MIPFGVKVKDRITGFTGTVVGRVEYLTGCSQACVVPEVDDKGSARAAQWFDEPRLEIIDSNAIQLDPVAVAAQPGCDVDPPAM